jgi:hypothetical protein
MAVVQLAEMLNVLPLSRASSLPQGTVVLGGCGHGAELLVGASLLAKAVVRLEHSWGGGAKVLAFAGAVGKN